MRLFALIFAMFFALSPAVVQATDTYADVRDLQKRLKKQKSFVVLDEENKSHHVEAFRQWFEGKTTNLNVLGYNKLLLKGLWQAFAAPFPESVFLLKPQADHSLSVFIQAPHQYYDRDTGKIMALLMDEGAIGGAAFNLAHRHERHDPTGIENDLAHRENSPFQAFTVAISQAFPESRIFQLHGFAKEKRKSKSARNSDFIVSASRKVPSNLAKDFANCLGKNLKTLETKLYPIDVYELGGTTNSQARMLIQTGYENFIHLEMSRQARKQLMENNSSRSALLLCMAAGEAK